MKKIQVAAKLRSLLDRIFGDHRALLDAAGFILGGRACRFLPLFFSVFASTQPLEAAGSSVHSSTPQASSFVARLLFLPSLFLVLALTQPLAAAGRLMYLPRGPRRCRAGFLRQLLRAARARHAWAVSSPVAAATFIIARVR